MSAETIIYVASREFDQGVALDALDKTIRDLKLGANYDGSRYEEGSDLVYLDFLAEVGEIDRGKIDASTVLPVHDFQTDATLDPGATPTHGDRYILSDTTSLHANFGAIPGVDDWDIVQYNAVAGEFEIVFNASAEDSGLVQNHDDHWFYTFNSVQWIPGNASGVIAAHDGQALPQGAKLVTIDHTEGALPVIGGKTKDKSILLFSCDLTKRWTWYLDAVAATSEVPSGVIDGSNKDFSLALDSDADSVLLDIYGQITDVFALKPHPCQMDDGEWGPQGGYLPVVVSDGVPLKQARPHRDPADELANKGRGWYWNRAAKTIHLKDAPTTSLTIDYWYVPKNAQGYIMRLVKPPEGKKWTIDYVETQFGEDFDYNDTIIFGAHPMDKPWFPLKPELHYTSMDEIDDYSIRSVPDIQPAGANSDPNNTRGTTVAKQLRFWEYIEELSVDNTTVDLTPYAHLGLGHELIELSARLEEGIDFGGSRATVTIRILESDA